MKNRKRNRMIGFDYSSDNLYFITICVHDRLCCFGNVVSVTEGTGRDLSVHHPVNHHPVNHHSENHYPQKYYSDKVIMRLNKYGNIVKNQIVWLENQYSYVEIHNYVVMPNHIHLILEIDSKKVKDGDVKIKSVSSLIGALKTTSSKKIHEIGFLGFSWQRSFHDHIIRNEKAYQNISNYIDLNPYKWGADLFFNSN